MMIESMVVYLTAILSGKRRGDVGYLKEWVLIKYSMILGASERV